MKMQWKMLFISACLVLLAVVSVHAEKNLPVLAEWTDPGVGLIQILDTSQFRTPPPWKIGLNVSFLGNSWAIQLREEFLYEASLHPEIGEIIITSADGQAAKQVAAIEDMIAQDCDLLAFFPISEAALVPVLEKAAAKGIPVVSNGSLIKSEAFKDLIVTEVSVDDYQFGRLGGLWLAEAMGYEGNIVALSGRAGSTTSDLRVQGAFDVFAEHPGLVVIAHEYADWAYPKGKSVMASLLPAYPEIDGVWSEGAAMTRGVIEAFEEAGRELVPMTGEDNNGFLKQWLARQDEGFDSIAPSKPTYLAAEAVQMILKILRGEPVPSITLIPSPIITGENLAAFVRLDLPDSYWTRTRLPESVILELFGGE
jgi:ribose transport system substrate-binding protein